MLVPRCESVSRQLRAWADCLQNSDIRGQQYHTEQSKAAYDQVRRTRGFMDKLRRIARARTPATSSAKGSGILTSEISDVRFEILRFRRCRYCGVPGGGVPAGLALSAGGFERSIV